MITSGSDAHEIVANLVDGATDQDRIYVLIEVEAAVHHLSDKYDYDINDVRIKGEELYATQQEREVRYLEQRQQKENGKDE